MTCGTGGVSQLELGSQMNPFLRKAVHCAQVITRATGLRFRDQVTERRLGARRPLM